MLLPSLFEVRKSLAEISLHEYTKQAWDVIEPGTEFKDNWHIEAICEHLEAVSRGEIRKLIINIPPRHMKSILTAVTWPTWDWIHKPSRRWLYATYSQTLSTRDSVKCRDIIKSQWYMARWGDKYQLKGDQNQKTRFENTCSGYRLATSVGGSLTGEGGDIIVIDDPLNSLDQFSEPARNECNTWWDQAMSTRLNDKKTGAYVIIMQRLHVDDLVGHVLTKEDGWNVLCLPQEYERKHPTPCFTSLNFEDPRQEEAELLWPSKEGHAELTPLKVKLGPYGVAGQLQQRPVPAEGAIIKHEWIRYYQELPEVKSYCWSWDTAIKEGQENDYSVGQLWAECSNGYYLVKQWRARVVYPDLKAQVELWYNSEPSSEVLVEDKASGQQLVQDFKRISKMPVIPVIPGRDMPRTKTERVHLVAPLFAAGKVFLPKNEPWTANYVDELTTFPSGRHDDQVDATTQYLSRRLKKSNRNDAPVLPASITDSDEPDF